MDSQGKQVYSAPRLVEYGRVEDITRGFGPGGSDFFFGGHDEWEDRRDRRHGHTSS
jgi:hypothetical protein